MSTNRKVVIALSAIVLLALCCLATVGVAYQSGVRISSVNSDNAQTALTITSPTPTLAPEFTSATAAPTVTPTPVAPTATPAAFVGQTVNVCPEASLGYHPDTGAKLRFYGKEYFATDANLLCEFEVYSLTEDYKIVLPPDGVDIVADWSHGWNYDSQGYLLDLCPIGPQCEGTWVAVNDFIVHKGDLAHVYVYQREQPAIQRFTTKISWDTGFMDPFACEYIQQAGHDMANIRVPAWADTSGTIYGFGFPETDPGFLYCEGASGKAGNPGHPTPK